MSPSTRQPATLVVLLLGLTLYLTIPGWFAFHGRHDNDFRHIYLGIQALAERESPYPAENLLLQAHRAGMRDAAINPYVYLPFTGLSMIFLHPLPFPAASVVWFCLNQAMLLACLWIMAGSLFPESRLRAIGALLVAAALNFPVVRTLTAGQLNFVLLLSYCGALALLMRGRDVAAGAVLGFAAVYKLSPALFIFYFIAVARWRAAATMVASAAACIAISLICVGWDIHLDFLPMLRQMGYGHSTFEQYKAIFWKEPSNQSLNSLFTHLMVADNGITQPWLALSQEAANTATRVATAALLLLIVAAWWKSRSALRPLGSPRTMTLSEQALFQCTILLSLLIPSLLWDHYLILLLLPMAWLMRNALETRNVPSVAQTCLWAIMAAVPWNFGSEMFRSGAGIPGMSIKLLPVLGLYLQCLAVAAGCVNDSPGKPLPEAPQSTAPST
ncbi:MAG: DUF2029 domain-containing protein [Candidatus Sumerlaeaceae bacterium]|nr:DUF2029 domain-containing protein [Candidatus Sumerlaeaceae bacterium]